MLSLWRRCARRCICPTGDTPLPLDRQQVEIEDALDGNGSSPEDTRNIEQRAEQVGLAFLYDLVYRYQSSICTRR